MQASCGEAKEFSLYRNVKNMRENEMNAARCVRDNARILADFRRIKKSTLSAMPPAHCRSAVRTERNRLLFENSVRSKCAYARPEYRAASARERG